ncbi:MAG: glycerate kinase [Chloroflexi bacterium]|nr:glycerate kinase [Chloroflexota bacterium]
MKVLIAPQSFKGSLSGMQAALAMAEGVRRVFPAAELVTLPVADGGDGTLDALVESTGGRYHQSQVSGPLGERVTARWGVMGDGRTAVIESAQACGLVLVPPERRDPLVTTTYGVGEFIRHALDQGYRRFIIGVGGSATNEGGAGMAQALGVRLLDAGGNHLPRGGLALLSLERVDCAGLDPRIPQSEIIVAVDVTNPLCGPQGAARTYGPQKGATPEVVELLDRGLERLAYVVRRDLGVEVKDLAGAGASGGLGAGLAAFLGARLQPGADLVCETLHLDEHLEGAHLVLVGEGRLDWQTAFNKAPVAVARRARARGIPVIAIAGSLGPGHQEVHQHGIDAALAIVPGPMPLEEAMRQAAPLLAEATERALRLVRIVWHSQR